MKFSRIDFIKEEGGSVAINAEKEKFRLKRKLFNKYNADEVDSYLLDLKKKISKLKDENFELVEKIKDLTEKLDSFKDKEETIRNALFMAEKLSSSCIKEAKEKAEKIIMNAKAQSNEMVASTNYEAIEQKDMLLKLRSYVKNYQNRMLLLFKDQLETLKEFMVKDESYEEILDSVVTELGKISNSRDIESNSKEFVEENLASDSREVFDSESFGQSDESGVELSENKDFDGIKKRSVKDKFKDLKFGESYSPNSASKKSRFGIFKKIRQN